MEVQKRWQMSRHPDDEARYNEAVRKLRDQIISIKEKYFRHTFKV
jgi:hypothetical protein